MSIVSTAVIGVLTALLSLMLRRHNAEISFVVAIIGAVLILSSVLIGAGSAAETVGSILEAASVDPEYASIMLKAVGICFLTEFACDCCTDAGQRALAVNVSLAGKVSVLLCAMPLYREILNTFSSLLKG